MNKKSLGLPEITKVKDEAQLGGVKRSMWGQERERNVPRRQEGASR